MNQEGQEDRDYWVVKYDGIDNCEDCGSELLELEDKFCFWCEPEEKEDDE